MGIFFQKFPALCIRIKLWKKLHISLGHLKKKEKKSIQQKMPIFLG